MKHATLHSMGRDSFLHCKQQTFSYLRLSHFTKFLSIATSRMLDLLHLNSHTKYCCRSRQFTEDLQVRYRVMEKYWKEGNRLMSICLNRPDPCLTF